MTFFAGFVILIISLCLCQIIDGIPNVLLGFSIGPWWLWLGAGSIILSWLLKD